MSASPASSPRLSQFRSSWPSPEIEYNLPNLQASLVRTIEGLAIQILIHPYRICATFNFPKQEIFTSYQPPMMEKEIHLIMPEFTHPITIPETMTQTLCSLTLENEKFEAPTELGITVQLNHDIKASLVKIIKQRAIECLIDPFKIKATIDIPETKMLIPYREPPERTSTIRIDVVIPEKTYSVPMPGLSLMTVVSLPDYPTQSLAAV